MPKVSVLIPAYNAESTVASAVESILRQTYTDLEVVFADDGSTDSTSELVASMSDPRIRVLQLPHGGIIPALNAGLAACRGELVARMDADDISHPRRMELQVRMMDEQPSLGVCSCLVRMFPRRDVLGGMLRYENWLNSLVTPEQIRTDMFVESPVAHPSVMLRLADIIELGGYQERGWPEDYDLWLRYASAGKAFAKVAETLVFWRQGNQRLTFTDSRYSVENFLRAKAFYLARMLDGIGRPVVLWGAGQTGRRISKHLIREGVDIQAVIDIDPKKIGRTMRERPVVSPEFLQGRRDAFVIAAVSSHGARELIRDRLRDMGFAEGSNFVCAA